MDDAIATYFRAWNEQDPDQRRRPLEGCVTADAVLVDPTGRWEGVTGLAERPLSVGCTRYRGRDRQRHRRAHRLVRNAWKIVDRQGHDVMKGIDVAERLDDGRLKRILMFHGPHPPTG